MSLESEVVHPASKSKAKQHTTPRTEKDKKEKEETKGRTVTDLYTSAFQLLNA